MERFEASQPFSLRRIGRWRLPLRQTRRLAFEGLENRLLLAADLDADEHLIVDAVSVFVGESGFSDSGENDRPSTAFTTDQAFLLHSRPTASKVIYLDFDGHTTTGTRWNTAFTDGDPIVTPAFDIDGSKSSFSTSELNRIIGIWQRVAEDYIPFDVDVTTEDPGVEALRRSNSGDANYGVRVVIGGSWSDWYHPAGGVAYLNSFDDNVDIPCFVFEDDVGNGNEKFTAEAASHEAGHTLGLSHDGTTTGDEYYDGHGTGATSWGPIMGVSYDIQVSQWSKGDYPSANEKEDDLAIITKAANGFTFRPDDHGNTAATATELTGDGMNITAAGVIERRSDLDYFSFSTAAGDVDFTITPAEKGPNLDILARLLDAKGNEVAVSNPVGSLSASISETVPAGTYYLVIDGTGKAALGSDYGYTDYGSLGQYSIVGSFTEIVTSSEISGTVWDDLDLDGVRDEGEPGLPNWQIYIDANESGQLDTAPLTFASASGATPLENGETVVSTITVEGLFGPVQDVNVTLNVTHPNVGELSGKLVGPDGVSYSLLFNPFIAAGPDFVDTEFNDETTGNIRLSDPPHTGSFKPFTSLSTFDGKNPNGDWSLSIFDLAGGQTGELVSWSLTIQTQERWTTTDEDGAFAFHNLTPGDYTIRQSLPEGWRPTTPDSDVWNVSLVAGEPIGSVDFGNTNAAAAPTADFNSDAAVDGGDFLAWQRGFGVATPGRSDGDANHDSLVDAGDLEVWAEQYGSTDPAASELDDAAAELALMAEGSLAVTSTALTRELAFAASDFGLTGRLLKEVGLGESAPDQIAVRAAGAAATSLFDLAPWRQRDRRDVETLTPRSADGAAFPLGDSTNESDAADEDGAGERMCNFRLPELSPGRRV